MHAEWKEERVVVMHVREIKLTTPNCISYPSLVSPKGISIIPASIKHDNDYHRVEYKQGKKKQGRKKIMQAYIGKHKNKQSKTKKI